VPETARHRRPDAGEPAAATQAGRIARHPVFLPGRLLVTCTYGGLFVFLAGSGLRAHRRAGLSPAAGRPVMSTSSLAYIAGTLVCRRWLPRHGLVGSVGLRGSGFTLAGSVGARPAAWRYALGGR
jgi:DHA1 family bicyclomycin/chloramphenicol resistance-like MFS transporter